MSHWFTNSTRWNLLVSKTRSVTLGSYQLLAAMASQPRDLRSALVSQARQEQNPVAISFLKLDREVGLVRYHGVMGYLQEKDFSFKDKARRFLYGSGTPQPDEDTTEKDQNTTTVTASSARTARVAFMITATQKAELQERLGFEETEIKKLTPLQAMLILEHNLRANHEAMEAKVEKLVLEYNAKLEEERQQQQAQMQEDAKLASSAPIAESEQQHEETLLLDTSHPRMPTEVILESPATNETVDKEQAPATTTEQQQPPPQVWYEVVETNKDVSEVVALYSNEKEAKFCLEIKEEFAERRAKENKDENHKKPSFAIRQR